MLGVPCEQSERRAPHDGFRRQRVLVLVADGLTEPFGSGVYVGEQGGVVSVQ